MSDRLKAMRRIVAMQAQAKRLAEWKLAAIEQRRAALETAQRELDGFADGGNIVGLLATTALGQARRLAQRKAVSEHEHAQQVVVVRAAETRHKLAERITEAAASEERAVEERRQLERLIEGFVARSKPGE